MIDAELLAHATPEELAQYEAALEAELALSSPADYAQALNPKFQRPPHVEMLSRTLVDLIEGRLLKADGTPFRKLMVSMPPRHGKSELISKYTPAWFLTRWPDRKVVVAGYEADFARSWGRMARDLLVNAKPGLAPALNPATTAADEWYTMEGGGMFTAGVGGPLTGKGAHALIIDDPVKNFEDARSETKRESAWNWALSTALSRIEPEQHRDGTWGEPGVAILVMTRWHGDDLAGRFIEQESDEWYQLVLPALAGDDDPLGRAPGEALWPERYPKAALEALRTSLGPQIFTSLYQQSPYIEGGGLFRVQKARYYNKVGTILVPSRHEEDEFDPQPVDFGLLGRFGVVDLAASTKTSADFSVFGHFGVSPDKKLYLLDAFRARIEGADHMATLLSLHEAWQPRFWGIERQTFGLTLLQTAARTGRVPVRELAATGDKYSRAMAAAALMEAGRLYFPREAPWLSDWIAELVAFDKGRHDDCVDVTAYAAKLLSDRLTAPNRRSKHDEPGTWDEKVNAFLKKRRSAGKTHPTLGAGY